MASDLSKNEDFQRLFLLELLVDSVNFDYKKIDLSRSTLDLLKQTCVRFNFLDFPVIEVCEEDFCPTQGNYNMVPEVLFRNGKSCFFSLRSLPQNTQCLKLGATIVRQKDESPPVVMGTTCITLGKGFMDVLNDMNHVNETGEASNSLKDVFPIVDNRGIKIGSLALLIRLSCFGKAIITHFKIPQEKEAGYMFANTNETGQINPNAAQMGTPIAIGYPVPNDQLSPPDNNIFSPGIKMGVSPGTVVPETVLGSTPMAEAYDTENASKTSPMIYRGFPSSTPGGQNSSPVPDTFPEGTSPGTFPGTGTGAYPGTTPNIFPGTAPGNFPDNFVGAAPGNIPVSDPNHFPGATQNNLYGAFPGGMPNAFPVNAPGMSPEDALGGYPNSPIGMYSGFMPASWGTASTTNDGVFGGFHMPAISVGDPEMGLYKSAIPQYLPSYASEIGMDMGILPYTSTNLLNTTLEYNIDKNIRNSYKELSVSINGHEFSINILRKSRPKKEKEKPLQFCGKIPEIENSDSEESVVEESEGEIEEEYGEKGDVEKEEEIPKIPESNTVKNERKKNKTVVPQPQPVAAPKIKPNNEFRLCECDIDLPKGFRLPEPPEEIKQSYLETPKTPPPSPTDSLPQTQVDSPPQSASNHAIVKPVLPPPPILSTPVIKEKNKVVKEKKEKEKAPKNTYCLQPDCPMGYPWPPDIPQQKRIIKVPCCSQMPMHPGCIGLKGEQVVFQLSNGLTPDLAYYQSMLKCENGDNNPYVLKLGCTNQPKCKCTKMILELPVPKLEVQKVERDDQDTQYLESDIPFQETAKAVDGKKKGKGKKTGKKGGKKGKKK